MAKYESLYKKKDVSKAAKIFWSQHDLLDSEGSKRAHAEDYLKTYGTKGGIDRAVVAEAVIAQNDWRKSCDEPLLYDSCLTVERKRVLSGVEEIEKRKKLEAKQKAAAEKAEKDESKKPKFRPPKRCGSPTQGVITVHRRGSKRADAAQARFKKIIKMVGKGDKIQIPRTTEARRGLPQCLGHGDGLQRGRKVRGVPAHRNAPGSRLRGRGVHEGLGHPGVGEEVQGAGQEGRGFEEAAWRSSSRRRWASAPTCKLATARSRAPVARTGCSLPRPARPRSCRTSPTSSTVPTSRRTSARRIRSWAYCDTLADQAGPVEQQALAAYEYCIERSTEFQFFNEFSRLCEEEMQQRDATKYPATNELFGVSVYTASRIDRVKVMQDPLGGSCEPGQAQGRWRR